jgi:hypothetical protein
MGLGSKEQRSSLMSLDRIRVYRSLRDICVFFGLLDYFTDCFSGWFIGFGCPTGFWGTRRALGVLVVVKGQLRSQGGTYVVG